MGMFISLEDFLALPPGSIVLHAPASHWLAAYQAAKASFGQWLWWTRREAPALRRGLRRQPRALLAERRWFPDPFLATPSVVGYLSLWQNPSPPCTANGKLNRRKRPPLANAGERRWQKALMFLPMSRRNEQRNVHRMPQRASSPTPASTVVAAGDGTVRILPWTS